MASLLESLIQDSESPEDPEVKEPVEEKEEEVQVEKPFDPSTEEGQRKDPKEEQDKLTPEHPRFRKVYGKMKELEETVEKLKADKERELEAIRGHNKALMAVVERLSPEDNQENEIEKITQKISELKTSRRVAREKLDYDKEDRIEEEIDSLKDKIRELKNTPKEKEEKTSTPKVDPGFDIVLKTDWYKTNPVMRGAAKELDKELSTSDDWKDKSISSRMKYVKDQIEKTFKYGKTRTPMADLGDFEEGFQEESSDKLSQSELEMAKFLKVSPKEYLKQKKLISKGVR